MVVEGPGRADDDVAPLHRVGFVLAHEHRFLGRLANQPRLTPQVAVGLGALARHEDLGIHPDGKVARFNADDRAHSRHSIRADGDDLPGPHQTLVNSLPRPVRGSVALARRRPPLASKPGTDQMVVRKKPFQIFVGCANVVHSLNLPGQSVPFDSTHHEDHKVPFFH